VDLYSREMEERIGNPLYLADCWKDIPPSPDGTIGRGSVKRAPEGREKYRRVYADSTKMSPLLAAFKMIRERYDESFGKRSYSSFTIPTRETGRDRRYLKRFTDPKDRSRKEWREKDPSAKRGIG